MACQDPATGPRPVRQAVVPIGSQTVVIGNIVMTDLGFLVGGTDATGRGINTAGQIVGGSLTTANIVCCASSIVHAFQWEPATQVMSDLGNIRFDGIGAEAQAITDNGHVVGSGRYYWSFSPYLFHYVPGVGMQLMPGNTYNGADGQLGIAYAENALGQVVGYHRNHEGSSDAEQAFIWVPATGVVTDLGTLGGSTSYAHDINDAGQVVGWSATAAGETHAFLWQNNVMQDLGTLGGTESRAYGINANGLIVGYSTLAPGQSQQHAFLWDPATGQMQDIGTLGGSNSSAQAINDQGYIVGTSNFSPASTNTHAFARAPGGPMLDLGVLPGGTSSTAYAINASGVIVGSTQLTANHATRWDVTFQNTPVADVGGPYAAVEGTAVSFTASGSSDADNDPLAYDWDFGDGTPHGTGATPTHTYADNGTYTVILTVSDPTSLSDTAVTTATIANVTPVVNAGSDGGTNDSQAFAFSGSFGDAGVVDGPWSYLVDWGDGSAASVGNAADQNSGIALSHLYSTPGSYTVTLTVTDKDGGSGSDNAIVSVTPSNHPPIASAGGPYAGKEGSAVNFSGAASSDPDGDLLTYVWSFGDGTSGIGVAPSHIYSDNGTYSVSLTVTDGRGGSGTSVTTASVKNEKPIPTTLPISSTGFGGTCKTGGSITLEISFTDAGVNDAPWSYTMDWGDKGPSTTGTFTANGQKIQLTHNYAFNKPVKFSYRLSVTDKDGLTGNSGITQLRCP